LVERDNKAIAVARQCELLRLSRSSYYYGSSRDDEYNLELMRLLDEQYTKVPFYGVRRRTAWLKARSEQEAGQGADAADGALGYFFPTTRRSYIRARDTAPPTRYILDIQPVKNLLS